MNSKYTNVLTMLLVVFIVVILGIMAYFVYDAFYSQKIESDAQAALDEFEKSTQSVKPNTEKKDNTVNETTNTTNEIQNENVVSDDTTNALNREDALNQLQQIRPEQTTQPDTNNQTTQEPEKVYMEDYEIKGSIKIPKTNIEYPILENVTKRSLEIAVGIAYPLNANLNEVGNVVIYGHNYRNGKFFSNNKKLANGDDIYITDQYGTTIVYEIYNIYETDANDADFFKRETNGKREISLQTCTDDGARRIIIWAVEK